MSDPAVYLHTRRSFTTSSYWLSFINVPLFFRDLHQPDLRSRMQSLVMSSLAMALLMKSSEIELGSRGRELALTFRNKAQACLEDACHGRVFDHTLAEAALVRASCPPWSLLFMVRTSR